MSWELEACGGSGLTLSQLRFTLAFVASVVVGAILRHVPTVKGARGERLASSKVQVPAGGSRQQSRRASTRSPLMLAGRHIFSLASGFLLVYYPFGNGSFHAVIPSLAVYICMRYFRRTSGTLAWLIAFPYLILACVDCQGV